MALTIPTRLQPVVIDLFNLTSTDRDKLLDALQRAKPATSITSFADHVAGLLPEHSLEWLIDVVRFVFSFYGLADTDDEREFIADSFMLELGSILEEDAEEVADTPLEEFQTFIKHILYSESSLGVSARAAKLVRQYERRYGYAEIFTDMRGLFVQDALGDSPAAAVITHSLKLHSHTSGSYKEHYFSMEYDDLQQLQKIVNRALSKHEGLRNMMRKANIQYVGPEGEEE